MRFQDVISGNRDLAAKDAVNKAKMEKFKEQITDMEYEKQRLKQQLMESDAGEIKEFENKATQLGNPLKDREVQAAARYATIGTITNKTQIRHTG